MGVIPFHYFCCLSFRTGLETTKEVSKHPLSPRPQSQKFIQESCLHTTFFVETFSKTKVSNSVVLKCLLLYILVLFVSAVTKVMNLIF